MLLYSTHAEVVYHDIIYRKITYILRNFILITNITKIFVSILLTVEYFTTDIPQVENVFKI